MDTPKTPTGQDIWQAIKRELTTKLYPLPFSTLAPTLYHVYLNAEDDETIEGIVPRIVADIANALTMEVERLYRETPRRGSRLPALLQQGEFATPVGCPGRGISISSRIRTASWRAGRSASSRS